MALADRLSRLDIPGRRVPSDNWHITLRFAGVLEPVAYERWLAALDDASGPGALDVHLRGLGAFPNPRRATVVWVGVESEGIEEVAARVEEAAQAAGLEPEERPYRPHLTVARVRPPADVRALVESEVIDGLGWKATSFEIMAAVGSRYRTFESFEL